MANRGEIAVRIFRTCRDLGIETVAVYSDADVNALHVRLADHAVRLGPAPAPESYLRGEPSSRRPSAGATAIHPGYGFLSEQSAFGAAVEAAGLTFVGPAPETLASLGRQAGSASSSTAAVGVPIVPGMFDPLPVGDDGAVD